MKRLAWFFPSFTGGGVQRVVLQLSQAFLEAGISVDLVVVNAHGPFLKAVPARSRVVDLRSSGAVAALPGLVSYLRTSEPDALISAQSHVNLVALVAVTIVRSRTRLILTEHSDMRGEARHNRSIKGYLLLLATRLLYPLADGIVAVSKGIAESVLVVAHPPRRKILTIYNAPLPPDLAELARLQPEHPWLVSKDVPVVLAVGRLAPEKDYANLLRAFAEIVHRLPARLIILGEGPERRTLKNLAASLRISDRVSMPGFVENPYSYMARADLFVLSSAYEGFPSVLVEALACGSRIVSTHCRSGPSEILDEGRYGALVPVGDSHALAAAMETALADKEFQPGPGMARAAEYSLDTAAAAYLRIAFGLGLS